MCQKNVKSELDFYGEKNHLIVKINFYKWLQQK